MTIEIKEYSRNDQRDLIRNSEVPFAGMQEAIWVPLVTSLGAAFGLTAEYYKPFGRGR